jgi:hypothetical protein
MYWNSFLSNCTSGVMVSKLVSSAVDHGYKLRYSHTKDYKISIGCISAMHAT